MIREQAQRAGAMVFFQDEASIRSDFHAGTTWGIAGETPVVKTTGARCSVNRSPQSLLKASCISAWVEGTVDSDAFIEYCKALLADNADRPVFLIVDVHPSHRSRKTKEWVLSTNGRIRLFHLPGYSPQLNPDEWVWKDVKADCIGKAGVASVEDLRNKAEQAIMRLASLPELLMGSFCDPNLCCILAWSDNVRSP